MPISFALIARLAPGEPVVLAQHRWDSSFFCSFSWRCSACGVERTGREA